MSAMVDLCKNEREELLCTYAALILHDEKMDVSAESINRVIKAAGATVEPYLPMLFARAIGQHNIADLIKMAGSAGCAAASTSSLGAGAATAAGQKAEEKVAEEPEPEEEEEEEDMGFSLFD